MTNKEHEYWASMWRNAWNLMPKHSAKMLLTLLGSYKIHGPSKRRDLYDPETGTHKLTEKPIRYCMANNTVYSNYRRGSKPKNPTAAKRLQMLGGPDGPTMFKALCIKQRIKLK